MVLRESDETTRNNLLLYYDILRPKNDFEWPVLTNLPQTTQKRICFSKTRHFKKNQLVPMVNSPLHVSGYEFWKIYYSEHLDDKKVSLHRTRNTRRV